MCSAENILEFGKGISMIIQNEVCLLMALEEKLDQHQSRHFLGLFYLNFHTFAPQNKKFWELYSFFKLIINQMLICREPH